MDKPTLYNNDWFDSVYSDCFLTTLLRGQQFRLEGFYFSLLPMIVPFDFREAPEGYRRQLPLWLYFFLGPIPTPNENTHSVEILTDDMIE